MLTKRDKIRKRWKKAIGLFKSRTRSPVPVFIFGEMRSGTGMLTECLDRSLSTEVSNETDEEAFDGYALRADSIIESLISKSSSRHVVNSALRKWTEHNKYLHYILY